MVRGVTLLILALALVFGTNAAGLSAQGSSDGSSYVNDYHQDGLTKAFHEFNNLLDYRSVQLGKPALVSIPAALQAPTAEARELVINAIAAIIAEDVSKFAVADLIQRDRVWDSVGIPPALAYGIGSLDQSGQFASTGVIAGQGIANISLALAKYMVGSIYLGQFQMFTPLVFYNLGNNRFRVWCRVHTVVERAAIVGGAPKPIRVHYYGEKVHEYLFTQGRYMLTLLENGMRHTFVEVPSLNNLAVAPGTAALYEDHSTVAASILPTEIFDWENLSA